MCSSDLPIVARAAENPFGLVSSSFALIRQLKDIPSAAALHCDLATLFDGTTRLEEHELLCPVPGIEVFEGVWKVANRSDAQGRTLARVAIPATSWQMASPVCHVCSSFPSIECCVLGENRQ